MLGEFRHGGYAAAGRFAGSNQVTRRGRASRDMDAHDPPKLNARGKRWLQAGAVAGSLGVVAFLVWQSQLSELPQLLIALTPLPVTVLLTLGLGRRRGEELRCGKCDYQVAPVGETSTKCPECGADWQAPKAFVKGHVVRRPVLIVLGVVCALPLVYQLFNVGKTGKWLAWMPTAGLLRDLRGADYIPPDIWQELQNRSLTAAQHQELASLVLDCHCRRGSQFPAADAYLEAYIRSAEAPEDDRVRYYRSLFRPRLRVPAWAPVGRTFRVVLEDVSRVVGGGAFDVRLYTAHRAPRADSPWVRSGRVMDGRYLLSPLPADGSVQIRAETPGGLHIEVRLWVMIVPTGTTLPDPVWDEEGQPVIPDVVIYAWEQDLRRVVDVRPE
jgi:hypothetical protein